MKRIVACALLVLVSLPARAADAPVVQLSVARDPDAVAVELFTSQGCSSCPPAQVFLGDLAHRTDVVALELHVDYWDDLKTLFSGSWKDPYSSSAWTQRQQQYNQLISGSGEVYTPQMVVDGRMQETGNHRSSINDMIEQAKALRKIRVRLTPHIAPDGKVRVTVDGGAYARPLHVVLARLEREAVTDVNGGENSGAHLTGHNIVKDMLAIGTWEGGKEDYRLSISPLKPQEGCAVLLQDPENMHILSANLCGLPAAL